MKSKAILIVLAVFAAALAASSFYFYRSASLERNTRFQKERELGIKQAALQNLEAKIAELNNALSDFRETSQKRINALEMSAREKEESANTLKDELGVLKKEKEAAIQASLEKGNNVSELTDQLTELQKEKEELLQQVAGLKDELKMARHAREAVAAEAISEPESQPYGMASDADLGASIDAVNLGEIVVSRSSGRAARVQEVNTLYDFVVIDAGEKDGIREGAVMNIVRHNSLIGKAVVRHARAGACAALILPEWKKSPIEKGDLITKF